MIDVAVIGGSFGGLNFAIKAASLGLNVTVFEKDKQVGEIIRTTGILTKGTVKRNNIPMEFCTNPVKNLRVCHESDSYLVSGDEPRVYMSETRKLLQYYKKKALDEGVIVKEGYKLIRANKTGEGIELHFDNKEKIRAKFLVGADGVYSKVASELGLSTNKKVLAAKEYIVKGNHVESDTFDIELSYDLAPGYIASNKNYLHVGVGGYPKKFSLNKALDKYFNKNLKGMEIVDTHAGIAPIGGVLKKIYGDKALLIGDAAGLVGPLTLAGIPGAIESGEFAAEIVKEYLKTGQKKHLVRYKRWCKRYKFVKQEKFLRRVFDIYNSKKRLTILYEASKENQNLVKTIFISDDHPTKRQVVKNAKLKTIFKLFRGAIGFR